MFAESLSYLHKMPDRDFTPYEVTIEDITAMRSRYAEWENELTC